MYSLIIESDPIPLNRCSGIANFPLPHSAICLQDKICSLCLSAVCETYFMSLSVCETLCKCSNLNTCPAPLPRAGGEVYTHSTLQRAGGGRARHHRDHDSGYTDKLKRLTKGVSISLPSSPLLPRQANIVPSQSCVRFPGGFKPAMHL